MSLIVWWIVSGWLAHSWTSRSPCSQAGSSESLGKVRIGVSFSGLRAARPYLSSNRLDPTDSVTVSPSAGTLGPSTSLSDGGWLTPRSGGVPPDVRNRARPVSVRSRSVSPALSPAVESNAATQVNGCLAAGSGVRIPAWRAPWKGYDGSVDLPVRTGRGGGGVGVGLRAADQHAASQRGARGARYGAPEEVAAAGVHDGTGSFAAVSGSVVLQGDPERTRPTPAPLRWPRRRARARTVTPRRARSTRRSPGAPGSRAGPGRACPAPR